MSTIVFKGTRSSRSSASIYRWVCRVLTFVIERIADYRISELDDLLPLHVADQIAKTELAVAA